MMHIILTSIINKAQLKTHTFSLTVNLGHVHNNIIINNNHSFCYCKEGCTYVVLTSTNVTLQKVAQTKVTLKNCYSVFRKEKRTELLT